MLILASASPRRKELLKLINKDFSIITSNIDESSFLKSIKNPFEVSENLATKKALDVFKDYKEDIVIGADTTIVFNNKIYGKPVNKDDAFNMLKDFSNNEHYVITGVCVVDKKRTISFSSISKVTFYELSDLEIEQYLSYDEYKDKAGSYAIQGKGGLFIKKIEGDYNNIVGLPVAQLNKVLKDFFNI